MSNMMVGCTMKGWQPLKVNITHMMDDFFRMYKEEPHEVLVLESIANALDAHASRIKITVENGFYSVEDNGKGMTEQQFEHNYHSLAFSTKSRGEGIGFAGVGAKLYLIFLDAGNKILTETRSKSFHGSSELTLVEGEPRWRSVDLNQLKHPGTVYGVQLHEAHRELLSAVKVMKIIQRHYNAILLGFTREITIEVNGIEVPPRKIRGKTESFIFNITDPKTKKPFEYRCHFYLSKDDLDDNDTGVDIVVFGKSIRKDWFVSVESIKSDYRRKIAGFVLSDGLSQLLMTNKADFKLNENPRLWANYRQRVYEHFKKWLQNIDAYQESDDKTPKTELLVVKRDVEEELIKIFKDPLISKYNPFMLRRSTTVTIPNEQGDTPISPSEGQQKIEGTAGGQTPGNGVRSEGPEAGEGFKESGDGKEKGEKVPRNARHSLNIGFTKKPDDPTECWFTPEAILINEAHPTFLKCQELGFTAEKMHLLRCVFLLLIENNPPNTIKEAFDDLRTFYKAWSMT